MEVSGYLFEGKFSGMNREMLVTMREHHKGLMEKEKRRAALFYGLCVVTALCFVFFVYFAWGGAAAMDWCPMAAFLAGCLAAVFLYVAVQYTKDAHHDYVMMKDDEDDIREWDAHKGRTQ